MATLPARALADANVIFSARPSEPLRAMFRRPQLCQSRPWRASPSLAELHAAGRGAPASGACPRPRCCRGRCPLAGPRAPASSRRSRSPRWRPGRPAPARTTSAAPSAPGGRPRAQRWGGRPPLPASLYVAVISARRFPSWPVTRHPTPHVFRAQPARFIRVWPHEIREQWPDGASGAHSYHPGRATFCVICQDSAVRRGEKAPGALEAGDAGAT